MGFLKTLAVPMVGEVLGRRRLWRFGRALYMSARGDLPAEIATNGELGVQARVLDAYGRVSPLVILDIGANVGGWTQPLLDETHRRGLTDFEIHAFEPVPETFQALSERVKRHPLGGRVHLVPDAVSSSTGAAEISVYQELGGGNSIDDDPSAAVLRKLPIKTVTVDAYCSGNNIKTIHLVKSDIEGHDMAALLGAEALFDQQRIMVWQFEYNHRWVFARRFLKDAFDFISRRPYKLAKVLPARVEVYDRWHPELERFFWSNYLLLHETTLKNFTVSRGSFDASNTYDAL